MSFDLMHHTAKWRTEPKGDFIVLLSNLNAHTSNGSVNWRVVTGKKTISDLNQSGVLLLTSVPVMVCSQQKTNVSVFHMHVPGRCGLQVDDRLYSRFIGFAAACFGH